MARSTVGAAQGPALAVGIFLAVSGFGSAAAHPRDYAVEVQAQAQLSPPLVRLTWASDAAAPFVWIYKKQLADTTWGAPLASLPGPSTVYTDSSVVAGHSYEYSLRKSLSAILDTVRVAGGSSVTFTIRDDWGDGICCGNGVGAYSVTSAGHTYASGGAFGAQESTSFLADSSSGWVDLIVSITLDVFGQETSWDLADDQTGSILASGGPYSPPRFGHILVGLDSPAWEPSSTVLLLVQEEVAVPLAPELRRLERDMIADGYRVRRREVSESAEVATVKQIVLGEHASDPSISTLFLLGHVPVPYSGDVQSAHPEQQGAWPADLYYGELDGVWTDSLVSNVNGWRPENHNVPGDGKFDQTYLPSAVDLEVGRVDLSRMPAFSALDAVGLLRRYLDKNHAWRTQNNHTLYTISCGGRQIHTALMGDPTLRMWVARPPTNLRLGDDPQGGIRLTWSPSPDSVAGYEIYRSGSLRAPFLRLTAAPVADTTFVDPTPLPAGNVYSVRALKPDRNASGTFLHLSAGVIDSLVPVAAAPSLVRPLDLHIGPNPSLGETALRCVLPRPVHVSLTIHSVAGAQVRALLDLNVPAGTQEWRWDGRDDHGRLLPSGVYHFRLRAGDRRHEGRVCLLR